jgi:hypothetical protein
MDFKTTIVTVGARTSLGWLLDAERTVARAHCAVARQWVFEPGIEPTRSALLRFNGAVLDWSPIEQHVSGVLH